MSLETTLHHIPKRERVLGALGALALAWALVLAPPADFPTGKLIRVNRGETADQIAQKFAARNVVRHPMLLKGALVLLGQESVLSGDYAFSKPLALPAIAWRLAEGEFGLVPVRLTLQEGMTVLQAANLLTARMPDFDRERFLTLAAPHEGFLFPDTYLFLPNAAPEDIITTMRANFRRKVTPLSADLRRSNRTEREIITMASILEEEAATRIDRRLISGILWKRILIGMPLQVDAAFQYVNGKSTYDLTLMDLKIDSPYNTYRYKGLPPGPISNPGIDSIESALNPIPSSYLYYLSDRNGRVYYAATFEQHRANRIKADL